MAYSQTELDYLITCPKRITDPPRREMKMEEGYSRNDFRAESMEGGHCFYVFLRRNERFPENFSIGLDYDPPIGGRVALLRVNGPHGDYNRSFDPAHPHSDTHVHWVNAEDVELGIQKLRRAKAVKEYASFEEAVWYFLKLARIPGDGEFFDHIGQMDLPFEDPETMK